MAETMTAAAPTRLDSLIANSPVASVVSNPRLQDNPIIACNQAFQILFNFLNLLLNADTLVIAAPFCFCAVACYSG